MSQHLFPVTPVNLSLKSCNWRCNIPFMLSIGGRYFFPPLPDTLEFPWIFFLPYWVLFHFLDSLVIIQSTCYLNLATQIWTLSESPKDLLQKLCCLVYKVFLTMWHYLNFLMVFESWYKDNIVASLVKWPHSGWVNTVVWRRRRDTCQYSKQIVSTHVHTLLYYILWRLVDHISWNCLYFRISIHIVLVETQHTQATAQVTLSFTTLHFFESVEHSKTAPTHFLFLK